MSAETEAPAADLLEKEGDAAADYLEGLLDIADLDGDIDIDVEGDRAQVSIVEVSAGELKALVGDDGKVLDALQELARLAAMNAFERKVVHDVVTSAGLVSESEGVDPDRRIVIKPAS